MARDEFHKAHSRTPFADDSHRDSLAKLRMEICLAHGIHDVGDALTVDETLFRELLKNKLQATDYESAIQQLSSLAPTDPGIIAMTQTNRERMKKFLPNYGHSQKK